MGLLVDIPKPGYGTTNDDNAANRWFFQEYALTSSITGLDEEFLAVMPIGLLKKELTPTKGTMYRAHRNIQSKLSKLNKLLEKERKKARMLQDLYNSGKFEFINENLNFVTKEFINSQLRNISCKSRARRWAEQDKAFALSLTLKGILAKIQFDTGINSGILNHLKKQVNKMKLADCYCSLLFDEISLSPALYYEQVEKYISVFKDIGALGQTNKAANHTLVFMVAAAQLSSSVASPIKTFVTFSNVLPAEAIYTAEFVHLIDELFDSLNSSNPQVLDHKRLKCALTPNSPHLEFWSKLLTEMDHSASGKDDIESKLHSGLLDRFFEGTLSTKRYVISLSGL
ncbi:hypothetical protein ILUMI_21427 [Ignelater luminosus]|uniref:Transposable element P transposase-like RNase H domain-containing protein n=1 Tax=Ignelater luminosus TaxID=2038154 RepID=A0A8K0CIT7_IGNLU|nr:hypothetical protein ILUMI_21427 [Ignelater luminosus]